MSNYSSALVFLESLAGYLICIVVALFALLVLWRIFDGTIDLRFLLSEKDGERPVASMSRFQLLIFIFVIAFSFFLVVISNIKIVQRQTKVDYNNLPELRDVPRGVLELLGISASSYAVSKAIQHGAGKSGNGDGGAEARAGGAPGGRPPKEWLGQGCNNTKPVMALDLLVP